MKTLILTFLIVITASFANAESRIYHWVDSNGVNHWSNSKTAEAIATDYMPAIQYDQAEAAYFDAKHYSWQKQWNIEADRALKEKVIEADVYKANVKSLTAIAVAKIKAAAKYAYVTRKSFAPTYGYSAGLVRSPNFGELRIVRKDDLQRKPLVVTNVKLNNNSKSVSSNKNIVRVKKK